MQEDPKLEPDAMFIAESELQIAAKEYAEKSDHATYKALESKALALAALHRPAPVEGPADLRERVDKISHNLKTQDNRITQDPIFVVQQKRRIWGPDQGEYIWKDDEWEDVDETKAAELDAADDAGEPTTGFTKAYYEDIWVFVTACFTEQGCKDYLRVNGHNLIEPRIYAETGWRNAEWIFLRKILTEQPAALVGAGSGASLGAHWSPPSWKAISKVLWDAYKDIGQWIQIAERIRGEVPTNTPWCPTRDGLRASHTMRLRIMAMISALMPIPEPTPGEANAERVSGLPANAPRRWLCGGCSGWRTATEVNGHLVCDECKTSIATYEDLTPEGGEAGAP